MDSSEENFISANFANSLRPSPLRFHKTRKVFTSAHDKNFSNGWNVIFYLNQNGSWRLQMSAKENNEKTRLREWKQPNQFFLEGPIAQEGPKWSKEVRLAIYDPFGPF